MVAENHPTNSALISYKTLRKAIGWIGILIPVILILGSFRFGECNKVQPSISHYYYTNVRELFVGALCSVGLFLFCYKGCSQLDSRSSNCAGFFAIIVAIFPTDITLPAYDCQTDVISLSKIPFHGTIHFVAAALFFLTLAFMSIVLFTMSNKQPEDRGEKKIYRNRIYRVCGAIMIGCVACIGVYLKLGRKEEANSFTLVFETIALLAFGFSWLTKGEAIARD